MDEAWGILTQTRAVTPSNKPAPCYIPPAPVQQSVGVQTILVFPSLLLNWILFYCFLNAEGAPTICYAALIQ